MEYFVTGGTGFIGRFLIPKLLDRGGRVHLLVREASLGKVDQLRAMWGVGSEQLNAVVGDLGQARLGLSRRDISALKGKVRHFVHLAAIYDMKADAESQIASNIEGTRHALACARALQVGCFHHVSSIAAAGLYEGTFTEDMFEEAENLDHPYFRTKHDSEGLVRKEKKIPWRIYRPGMVVGDSQTGEMDKVDGPYYFFDAVRRISKTVPSWMRAISVQGGELNIVPVDFVVDAMDYLAHQPRLNGRTFFLTDPDGISVGDVLSTLMAVAHGPSLKVVRSELAGDISRRVPLGSVLKLGPVRALAERVSEQFGVPLDTLSFVSYPTHFDSTRTQVLLSRAGIECPPFEDYAGVLWEYWEANLRSSRRTAERQGNGWQKSLQKIIGRNKPQRLQRAVSGKVAVVTGATSGIGYDCAIKLGEAGAKVVLAARTPEKLDETIGEIESRGGQAWAYACDLSDMDDCDRFVAEVLGDHGEVDILINNAGRSIRRAVRYSFDRFHDFERTMQLNYFGALRLILGFAPVMLERKSGHIINISSIGVLASPPRFSAYVASKAALDAFSWCAAAEFASRNVRFTTVNMPLVRTPMISPTKLYDAFPTLTPDEAAELVMSAIVEKPKRVATALGIAGAVVQALAPNTSEFVLNQAYHLFPDSSAARGVDGGDEEGKSPLPANALKVARRMFVQMLPGVHW